MNSISSSTNSTTPITPLKINSSIEESFNSTKEMLLTAFEVNEVSALPFKIEYADYILNTEYDFEFGDKEARLIPFLPLMASLHASKKEEKICFISPTYYYAEQAAIKRKNFLGNLKAWPERAFSCVVPGMAEFENEVNKCTVLFMHGKDYSKYLPENWKGRKIIQIFPDEEVPVDPIKRSCCSMQYCLD